VLLGKPFRGKEGGQKKPSTESKKGGQHKKPPRFEKKHSISWIHREFNLVARENG